MLTDFRYNIDINMRGMISAATENTRHSADLMRNTVNTLPTTEKYTKDASALSNFLGFIRPCLKILIFFQKKICPNFSNRESRPKK